MLYPGKDKSGREFPFLIFSLLPGSYFKNFHLIPAALKSILDTFDEMLRKENDISSLNNSLKNYTVILPPKDSLQIKFNEYLSDTTVNDFLKRTNLNFTALKLTDITYSDSTTIKFSFYSDNIYFGFDAGVLLSLLIKRIALTYNRSSLFWNQSDDGKFQIIIFPIIVTAVNFVDLLSICEDSRVLNLFSKVSPEVKLYTDSNILLKQLFNIS